MNELQVLQKENAELKSALRKICEIPAKTGEPSCSEEWHAYWRELAYTRRCIASEVLCRYTSPGAN